jgi:hypothetical protein
MLGDHRKGVGQIELFGARFTKTVSANARIHQECPFSAALYSGYCGLSKKCKVCCHYLTAPLWDMLCTPLECLRALSRKP